MGNQISTDSKTGSAVVKPLDNTYNGRKFEFKQTGLRALVIGCNYRSTDCPLGGCINDALSFIDFLRTRQHGKRAEILFLNDEGDRSMWPTYENIIKGIAWLDSDEKADEFVGMREFESRPKNGTTLLIYFAGHGTQSLDTDCDEVDGLDECICTINEKGDFGVDMTDDLLRSVIGPRLRPTTYWVLVTDCCHSGTVSDLKYRLVGRSFLRNLNYEDSKGPIVHISACFDSQTAKEGEVERKEKHGYFTYALIKSLKGLKLSIGGCYDRCCMLMSEYIEHDSQLPQLSVGMGTMNYSTILPI